MTGEETEESKNIKLKQCPKCRTVIRRNPRYGTLINATLVDIENVKNIILGKPSENQLKQKTLEIRLENSNIRAKGKKICKP